MCVIARIDVGAGAPRAMMNPTLRFMELPFELPEAIIGMIWSPASTADAGHAWLRAVVAEAGKQIA